MHSDQCIQNWMTFIKVRENWGTAQVLDIRYYDYILGALSCSRLLSVFHGYHKSRSYVSPFPSTTMFCPTMGLDAMKPA